MQSVTIGTNQAGQRMDKFLRKYLPQAGSGFLYKMLRKKNITLNGKKAEGNEILALGDEIRFFFSDETFAMFSGREAVQENSTKSTSSNASDKGVSKDPKKLISKHISGNQEYWKAYNQIKNIRILLETQDVLILDKPAGILTQKAEVKDLSLNEWLIGYLLHSGQITEEELQTFRPSVCNRLDRNTSGIVLCGKSLKGSQALSSLIKERRIGKFYRTICLGKLEQAATLEGYLEKNEQTNRVTLRKSWGSEGSKQDSSYIRTHYEPISANNNYTLLEVELITGKTHQIRAHLSGIGHPLIGDYKYGDRRQNNRLKKQFGLEYQLLHAYRVEFPDTCPQLPDLAGQTVIAEYPQRFHKIMQGLSLQ